MMDPDVSPNTALVPVRQQVVAFHNDSIPVAQAPDGNLYVAIRPITDALGLHSRAQRARIAREPFLAEGTQTLRMTGADGRRRAMFCLRVDLLNAWLLNLDTTRVRAELQEKITYYKRECAQALWRHFQGESPEIEPAATPEIAELIKTRDLHRAMMLMADAQIALAQRAADAHTRLDRAGQVVKQLDRRLAVVEGRLDPNNSLTEEQAAAVSQRVRELALALTVQDKSKNHFQGIFNELYRRYRASDYKHIRHGQFAEVMAFLDEWGAALRMPK